MDAHKIMEIALSLNFYRNKRQIEVILPEKYLKELIP
jgi:hypothetical protein